MMRAPAGRGLVAIGNAAGQLGLADPRAGGLFSQLASSSACSEFSWSHPCDTDVIHVACRQGGNSLLLMHFAH